MKKTIKEIENTMVKISKLRTELHTVATELYKMTDDADLYDVPESSIGEEDILSVATYVNGVSIKARKTIAESNKKLQEIEKTAKEVQKNMEETKMALLQMKDLVALNI